MQAVFETTFDIVYLVLVITLGIIMVRGADGRRQYFLFGLMAIVLGGGDAFHLVPRAIALCTTGLESYTAALGIGTLVTSITMTIFYVLLYWVWRERYHIQGRQGLSGLVYVLAAARIALCCFPQNEWTSADAPLSWGIYRNLPFLALGIVIIVLFHKSAREHDDSAFRFMWLTIVLSFGFYLPVVLFSNVFPPIGVLMIPKTLAYIWTVCIGFNAMRHNSEPYFRKSRVK